ncbi:GLPGLI family protein [Marinilabiliaceae bacterium JC040]|nr:GLPGLI family protein [Marinilabiliaceae bacterium JC040]
MKNKYYLFLTIFIIVIFSCKTQQNQGKQLALDLYWENLEVGAIDICKYKILYTYTQVRDTFTNKRESFDLLLKIGSKYSLTYCPLIAKIDSLEMTPGGIDKAYKLIIETQKKRDQELHRSFTKFTYKDKVKNIIFEIDNAYDFHCMYKEPQIFFNWEILSDTDLLLGYKVKKAKCTFRGRTYIAWFTEEIPISEGPWKFSGLPGLILKVYDTQNHYTYNARGFELDGKSKISIMKSCLTKNQKYHKIGRKDFLKEKMGYGYDWFYMSMRNCEFCDVSISRREKLKYDEMERDYR